MKTQVFLLFFGFFYGLTCLAKYSLPKNLDAGGREALARSLGFGAAMKMAADPRPLGGYDGFQISYSRDYVDISTIKGIGTEGGGDNMLASNSIMVGKGLYYDVDVFLQFTPPQNEEMGSYGAVARASLYTFRALPFVLGGLIHGSLSQYSNLFGSSIFGYDLYLSFEWKSFVLFSGLGQARGIHTFIGGPAGLTGADQNLGVDLLSGHLWGGIAYRSGRWILSGLSEVYFEPLYSVKLGYNF